MRETGRAARANAQGSPRPTRRGFPPKHPASTPPAPGLPPNRHGPQAPLPWASTRQAWASGPLPWASTPTGLGFRPVSDKSGR